MPLRKPKLAVWKFSSCDGCQLSLLDCEDELLAVAGAVEIANFPEASRAVVKGPYDLSLVEGSITTPHDAERIHGIRRASKFLVTIGACATAGGIQALRNFKEVKEFISIVYARPDYIETLKKSTPDHRSCVCRFRTARLPHQQVSAGGSAQRVSEWPQAEHAAAQRVRGVQTARHRLRDGCAGHALPRPGDPRWLRRSLPRIRARVLRMLWAEGNAEHRLAECLVERARRERARFDAGLPRVQRLR